MRLSPDARWERARIVLIRTPFRYSPPRGIGNTGSSRYPVVMLIGYTNLPEDFDSGVPDFVRFVNQIHFHDAPPGTPTGVQVVSSDPGPSTPAPPQAPPPAPASSPAPVGANPQDADEQWRPPPDESPPPPL